MGFIVGSLYGLSSYTLMNYSCERWLWFYTSDLLSHGCCG